MQHVVIRGKKAGSSLADVAHVTPLASGLNGLATVLLDSSGNAPGDTGYTGAQTHTAPIQGQGRKTVAVTATPVALSATSVPCSWVKLQGLRANSAAISAGLIGVVAASGTETGEILEALDSTTISTTNLNLIYINGTAGDGVSYTYG